VEPAECGPSTPDSSAPPNGARGRVPLTPGALRPARQPSLLDALAAEERELLTEDLRIKASDIYPTNAEPHFLIEPPAPGLGEVDDRYVELPAAGRQFKRVRQSNKPGARVSGEADADSVRAGAASSGERPTDAPTGGMQFIALLMGLGIRASQGALAGACLMQVACSPWPDDDTLVRPLAYAKLALPLQRALHVLATTAFLGACDVHAASPSAASVLAIILHATVVLTFVLSLPTDVALPLGLAEREPTLQAAFDAAGVNLSAAAYEPALLPITALEEGSGFFSTALSAEQFGFWQGLLWVRAVCALLAWLIASLTTGQTMTFAVPPVLEEYESTTANWRG
jgi:hypothetical protein